MYKIWFARYYRCQEPNTLLLDNALATMGAGLPSGMAAKMVHPNRKVVAIAGDGGFMMNSQEMETAVRLGLNITVLVLNDNSYGMIRWKQANMGFADFGLTYGNPDFVKYAESYGGIGHRVDECAHEVGACRIELMHALADRCAQHEHGHGRIRRVPPRSEHRFGLAERARIGQCACAIHVGLRQTQGDVEVVRPPLEQSVHRA
jgi:TPP-dependent trihydroxycyclohexane-1,2-dione (THcHDO) dehydratase